LSSFFNTDINHLYTIKHQKKSVKMLFRAAASAAILAAAVNASAEPKPYRLASMPVLGMSLVRRDTNGYQPEQTACSDGDTCAEACGTGFQECSSTGDSIHCFNPEADQQCCTDGSGNSCDAGYYCTHDTSSQTWCCPDAMDLTECAAAYGIESGLETPEPSTSAAPSTTTSAAPTTTAEPTTTEVPTTTEISTTELTTSAFNTTTAAISTEETTSYLAPTSAGFTSAWSGSNSTIASIEPTQPAEASPSGPAGTNPGDGLGSGAATTGVSALLVLAAGVIAFL
jgi:hypothetical protein